MSTLEMGGVVDRDVGNGCHPHETRLRLPVTVEASIDLPNHPLEPSNRAASPVM
ncbi:MAG: hypothetical protein KY432_00515 [Acidobacteria bacterium]|nr:hypothetical protein [Acidobacteriota bacterium]